jgi:hypothetical protein
MSFRSQTYAEALEKRRNKPQKARKPLTRAKTPIKASGRIERKTSLGSPVRATKGISAKGKTDKKKPKKLTDGQLKKRVWKEFSIFVRTRHADAEGFNDCVTCDARKHWKELQAGHFIRGRLNVNLFNEYGCWPQCYGCNVGRDGNVVVYYQWMLKAFGQSMIDELVAANNHTHKWQPGQLAALLEKYRTLNANNPLLQT